MLECNRVSSFVNTLVCNINIGMNKINIVDINIHEIVKKQSLVITWEQQLYLT